MFAVSDAVFSTLIDCTRLNIPPNTLYPVGHIGDDFYRSYDQTTVSKHWRKPVGLSDKAWIPPGPVRTAHMSVLLTVTWHQNRKAKVNILTASGQKVYVAVAIVVAFVLPELN